MDSFLLPGDTVHVSVSPDHHCDAVSEKVAGTVVSSTSELATIEVRRPNRQNRLRLPLGGRCKLHKIAHSGLLESDAIIEQLIRAEEKQTLTVFLLGTPRNIQRRSYCRIEIRSEIRYCDLASAHDRQDWKIAELREVSLGGALLSTGNEALKIGQKLLTEFVLNEKFFAVPAVVRRCVTEKSENEAGRYGIEYFDLDQKQQNSMAKEMTQLQIQMINSRVKVD